jgi:hypothetical protein
MMPTARTSARRRLVRCMTAQIHFSGPDRYRLRSAADLGRSVLGASVRRMLKGPLRPGWSWFFELGAHALKRRVISAFRMRDVNEARCYLDSVDISSPVQSEVNITRVAQEKFIGAWFFGKGADDPVTIFIFTAADIPFTPGPTPTSSPLSHWPRHPERLPSITVSRRNTGSRRSLKMRSTPTAGC